MEWLICKMYFPTHWYICVGKSDGERVKLLALELMFKYFIVFRYQHNQLIPELFEYLL